MLAAVDVLPIVLDSQLHNLLRNYRQRYYLVLYTCSLYMHVCGANIVDNSVLSYQISFCNQGADVTFCMRSMHPLLPHACAIATQT